VKFLKRGEKMCELLGMSFNQPVNPSLSFRGFRHRGETNPHGWGIAYYPDESVQVIKEPIRTERSTLSEFLMYYPENVSKIFIAHVRYTSGTAVTHKNTHPFYRELNGREFVFAHNGTLHNYRALKIGRFKPVGETDSEYAFCHIINCVEERGINKWTSKHFGWLWNQLKNINNHGNFNCLFSDGEYLFCYYDKGGYNSLCFVRRKAPFNTVHLKDEDFEINLSEKKDSSQKGFIIATRRLTDERWENFHRGELIVFKNGDIVYSSSGRDTESFLTLLQEKELNILRILRQSPHKVSLLNIYETLNLSKEEIRCAIHTLLNERCIKQDSRDRVKWDHDDATYYTVSSKRNEIDGLIGN
jgi:predicted glutamine amidotransferase